MNQQEKSVLRIVLMQAIHIMEKFQKHLVNFTPNGLKNEESLMVKNSKEVIKLIKKIEISLR